MATYADTVTGGEQEQAPEEELLPSGLTASQEQQYRDAGYKGAFEEIPGAGGLPIVTGKQVVKLEEQEGFIQLEEHHLLNQGQVLRELQVLEQVMVLMVILLLVNQEQVRQDLEQQTQVVEAEEQTLLRL